MTLTEKFVELRTSRLHLRPMAMSDKEAVLNIFSDEQALKYWGKEPIRSIEEAESMVQQELDWVAAGSCMTWALALPDSDQLVGKIVLFQLNEQNQRAEIGYIVDRRYWGQGYMSEAIECVLGFAFDVLELHRIEADTDPENSASLAVLDKFGFSPEGRFRDRWYVHGKWHDSIMLGLLEKDYRRLMKKG